ncbi:MAG: hypothetical protein H7833_19635 [Magnetococcus sp. DMHC-1]|nr:hypothetical protein [Magnetococcales bacterium]
MPQRWRMFSRDGTGNRLLNPATFAYKRDPAEKHVGFVAEDVPDLLATQDRKGLSAMDVVAVVTKVVQKQQKHLVHPFNNANGAQASSKQPFIVDFPVRFPHLWQQGTHRHWTTCPSWSHEHIESSGEISLLANAR